DCSCSKGSVEDKILVPKPSENCARCAKCGHPFNGPYCQGCTLLREKLEEDLVTYFQKFPNTFESSDGSSSIVNAPREPFVVKQDHGVNPSHIDECCCECGEALDGIICQRCACKSCGKGAHIGYNCPPKVSIISDPEPCNQTMNNEPPQTLPSFDSTCYSDKEISVPCVSKPNFVDESSNIFNRPPQPPIYSGEFFGSNAQYGHYCTPQAPFINPEPVTVKTLISRKCQPMNQNFYNSNSSGFDQTQPPQFPVVHPPPQKTSIDISHDQEHVINSVQTFLRKFNRYSFFETPNVLLLAWDRVSEIKDAFDNKQYKSEDLQELFCKLLEDLQNIHEELAEFINSPSWNRPAIYDDDDDDVEKIVIPEDEEIEDDNLREKLFKVDLLIAEIEEFKDNPTLSSEFLTKSSSTSPFLEGTNSFHNSLPEFENFCFDLEEISSGIEDDYSPLLAYVVWIFVAYLTYPIIPPHLHSFRNEDTIFDLGITINRSYSFKPGLSHRCGTFKEFNTHRSHLNKSPMEMLFSTLFPMDQ
nr:hypothetical protein [Tanacetum cinerariifolium]